MRDHAVERPSLRSEARRSHPESQLTKTGDDAMTSDWYGSRHGSVRHLERRDLEATVSHIPLVHVASKADVRNNAWLAGEGANGRLQELTADGTVRMMGGFDAV